VGARLAQDLLLNFLLILTPIFFYQAFMLDRLTDRTTSHRTQWVLGLFFGLASVLCMIYPIQAGEGFLWDLRWIPLLMATLYGGWRSGLVVAGIVLLCRLWVGVGVGLSFWLSVGVAVIVLGVSLWLRRWYLFVGRRYRMLVGMMLALATYLLTLTSIIYYFSHKGQLAYLIGHGGAFFVVYALLYVLAMTCSVLLFENILENVRIREEVRKSEKLGIISELAASIAHEVRNPLTVVRGFIQLAVTTLDETNRKYMRTAITELDRAEFIISDYLNFAKPELNHFEVVNASDEVRNVVTIMCSYANMQSVQLEGAVEDSLYIWVDRVKFKQVLMNLIKNAIEAIYNSGRVEVTVKRRAEDVIIQITDTGEGMTPEQLERLGQPFYSTKEKGTGLGLMVTFRILEAMNGSLHFASTVGKGTEARIVIPLSNLS